MTEQDKSAASSVKKKLGRRPGPLTPPHERVSKTWYEKVHTDWAIRRVHRYQNHWVTIARVLWRMARAERIDPILLHEAEITIDPPAWREIVGPNPRGEGDDSFANDYTRLCVLSGIGPVLPFVADDATRGAAPGTSPVELEALRRKLYDELEPTLRKLMKDDPQGRQYHTGFRRNRKKNVPTA